MFPLESVAKFYQYTLYFSYTQCLQEMPYLKPVVLSRVFAVSNAQERIQGPIVDGGHSGSNHGHVEGGNEHPWRLSVPQCVPTPDTPGSHLAMVRTIKIRANSHQTRNALTLRNKLGSNYYGEKIKKRNRNSNQKFIRSIIFLLKRFSDLTDEFPKVKQSYTLFIAIYTHIYFRFQLLKQFINLSNELDKTTSFAFVRHNQVNVIF